MMSYVLVRKQGPRLRRRRAEDDGAVARDRAGHGARRRRRQRPRTYAGTGFLRNRLSVNQCV